MRMTRSAAVRTVAGVGTLVLLLALGWILPAREWTIALAERIRGEGLRGALLFVAIYAVAAIAFVPGSLLTMAAGFAYGPVAGLIVASPASVLAATAAFVLGRTLLRGWIQRKIARSPTGRALDRAIAGNSFKLILLLRLSPAIPYNVLNYALGLSNVSLGRYVAASFLGMLPGAWLYVYLGSLARTAAGLDEAGRSGGPQRVLLAVIGLAATVAAVVLITRAARRELDAS